MRIVQQLQAIVADKPACSDTVVAINTDLSHLSA
jgi:hypothetical protein